MHIGNYLGTQYAYNIYICVYRLNDFYGLRVFKHVHSISYKSHTNNKKKKKQFYYYYIMFYYVTWLQIEYSRCPRTYPLP